MRMPPQMMPTPRHTESASVADGRRVRRTAAAAGAIRSAVARRIPTARAPAAAAKARMTRKTVERKRTGPPGPVLLQGPPWQKGADGRLRQVPQAPRPR